MQIENVNVEYMEGYGLSVLLTAQTSFLREKIWRDFCSQSALPWGGIEVGLETFVSPDHTPDHQYGVICSLWIQGRTEDSLSKLFRGFIKRFRYALLPHLSIHIFAVTPADSSLLPISWSIPPEILQFADGYETTGMAWGRSMLRIPRMGGDLFIETQLYIREGFLGFNLWLYFDQLSAACLLEEALFQLFQEQKLSPGIALIYGLAASGTKLGSIRYYSTPVTTNHEFCASLYAPLNSEGSPNFLADNPPIIAELVLDFYDLFDLTSHIPSILILLRRQSHITKISSGSYKGCIGSHSLNLTKFI